MSEQLCWINVGPGGRFRKAGNISSSPSDVDKLLGDDMAGKPRLVLHFHGGLVPEDSGRKIAEAMAAHYGDQAFSIGLVWETGFFETYQQNLDRIGQSRLFRKALSWIVAKALGQLEGGAGAKGAGAGSADPAEIEEALDAGGAAALDASLTAALDAAGAETRARGGAIAKDDEAAVEALATDLQADFASDPSLVELIYAGDPDSQPIRDQLVDEQGARSISTATVAWFVAKVIFAVIRRYRRGTHHDLLPTAVEELLRAAYLSEIGASAWEGMKEKARDMWQDDGESPGMEGHVGGYLLRRLEALQAQRPEVCVDLVGHSAGSIAICHMLAAIQRQGRAVRPRNIIFMAPAVRLDLFAERIARRPSDFAHFRQFTMCNDWEKKDKLVGGLYPRSLLFFISGLLEDKPGTPLAGLARYLSGTDLDQDYQDVRDWLAAHDRLVLSPSADIAGDGLRSRSASHGGFDNDPDTLASLLHMATRP